MKEKIMESAMELFSQKGYYQTGMDDIAAFAGVAKGTLYYYFKNKSQLFSESVVYGMDYIHSQTQKIIASDQSPKVIAENIISLLVDICIDHSKTADMVMTEPDSGIDSECMQTIRAAKDAYISLIAQIIDDGISENAVKLCSSRAAAAAVISYIYSFCRNYPAKEDKASVKRQICALLLRGLIA